MTIRELIEHLKTYGLDTVIAYDLWLTDDILDLVDQKKITLTSKEAEEVLDFINRKKDAEIGINWTVIACAIDEIISE